MKIKFIDTIALAAVTFTLVAGSAAYAEKQTSCPITGGEINKDFYADVEGKRIYVCCEGCIEKVKADSKKYTAKLEKAGVELENAPNSQTVCPVMGGKIDKNLYVDAEGKRVYVCCAGCIDKVKDNPGKFIKQLENSGVTLEKAGR